MIYRSAERNQDRGFRKQAVDQFEPGDVRVVLRDISPHVLVLRATQPNNLVNVLDKKASCIVRRVPFGPKRDPIPCIFVRPKGAPKYFFESLRTIEVD